MGLEVGPSSMSSKRGVCSGCDETGKLGRTGKEGAGRCVFRFVSDVVFRDTNSKDTPIDSRVHVCTCVSKTAALASVSQQWPPGLSQTVAFLLRAGGLGGAGSHSDRTEQNLV